MKHLKQVGMTYIQHFVHANRLSAIYTKGAIKCFVHSIYPEAFTNCATSTQSQIQKEMNSPNGSSTDKYNDRED